MSKNNGGTNQMRLDKFLADSGLGSRKEVKLIIKKKRVTVNDTIIRDDSYKVNEKNDTICLDGNKVNYQKFIYFMLNKPRGVVSATEDAINRTVLDILPKQYVKQGVFPVGRLDKDTTGLLLLTNDGDLSHQLLSPKKHVDKCYFVTLEKPVTATMITALETGITLADGYQCLPAKVKITNSATELFLTIQEGKFHQIKRMMHAVTNNVVALKRISMGPLQLDQTLTDGGYRLLTPSEIHELYEHKKS